MKSKDKLSGGYIGNPFKQIEVFFSMIILGYFGVQILYGYFFKFYPFKYYFRNLDINYETNTNLGNPLAKKIVMNSYMPGLWNNEMTDFITTIVLSIIIFVYTNVPNRSMISEEGNLNPALLFGFLIGLGYPPIVRNVGPMLKTDSDNNLGRCVYNYLSVLLITVLILTILISNYRSINLNNYREQTSYLTYFAVIVLLIFGLIISRKKEETISKVNYYNSSESNCRTKTVNYIKSSGQQIEIRPTFVVFLLLLLFSYNPQSPSFKYGYIFVYGILLGVFVSGISYYGIEYFLVKTPVRECETLSECKEDILTSTMTEEEKEDETTKYKYNMNTNTIIKLTLILALIFILSYLIYNYSRR
tara:strand:+ start:732 stop:1811 length:1080 start_codon:yes stop_codon:yes gene_type:complete